MALVAGLRENMMDHVFGGGDFSRPGTIYVGLSTTTPTDAGANLTEPANGYGRVAVTNNATNFPASSTADGDSSKTNGTVIQFPEATGSWGTPTHWFMSTADSGGTILATGAITNAQPVANLNTVRFPAETLVIKWREATT